CRCRPTTTCSSARTPSTCSMLAAPSPSRTAPGTSCACAGSPRRSRGRTWRWRRPVPDLLVEIGCEELPAAACRQAEAQLPDLLSEALAKAGIGSGEHRFHVAPRRLAAIALDLPAERAAERSEVRGPRADAPEQALAG